MNQTQKRLQIIKLAISIGDMETVHLQKSKLLALQADKHIKRIIEEIDAENYATTQSLIDAYIQMAPQMIVQRTPVEEEHHSEEEERVIEEFELFRTPTPQTTQNDALFTTFQEESTSAYEEPKQEPLSNVAEEQPKDDFFYDLPSLEAFVPEEPTPPQPPLHQESIPAPTSTVTPATEPTPRAKNAIEQMLDESEDHYYQPISYAYEKYTHLRTQYPPLFPSQTSFESVKQWLSHVSTEGYTESEVEEMIEKVTQLQHQGNMTEAAHLLLAIAATHSPFAHFMLARAIFKGELFEANSNEAFEMMKALVVDEAYPEAICDLAQMYESGIGTEPNLEEAYRLYREAANAGIKRAQRHCQRIEESQKGWWKRLFAK